LINKSNVSESFKTLINNNKTSIHRKCKKVIKELRSSINMWRNKIKSSRYNVRTLIKREQGSIKSNSRNKIKVLINSPKIEKSNEDFKNGVKTLKKENVEKRNQKTEK
jgi:hypothetical protein